MTRFQWKCVLASSLLAIQGIIATAVAVVHAQLPRERGGQPAVTVESSVNRLMTYDTDGDGKLSKGEVTDSRLLPLLQRCDANNDGIITRDELMAQISKEAVTPARPGNGTAQTGPRYGGEANSPSGPQISEISGHPEILKKQWNSLPDVLIDRTPYAIFSEGLRTDWLITQTLFDHRESIPTKQGSAVMEIGKRVFLTGAIDRTLKRFEFGAEFKIDGKRLMTTGPITGGLPVEEMGVDLPDGFADLRKLLPKTKE